MDGLISNKGTLRAEIRRGSNCVVITTHDTKKHTRKSITVFDEMLPGLISQLISINYEIKAEQTGGNNALVSSDTTNATDRILNLE